MVPKIFFLDKIQLYIRMMLNSLLFKPERVENIRVDIRPVFGIIMQTQHIDSDLQTLWNIDAFQSGRFSASSVLDPYY